MIARQTMIAMVSAIVLLASPLAVVDAHRPVVSPYTFHRDVRPILEKRCGQCHAPGGVSVPLLRFEDARVNTWPMRQALVSGRMPPWYAEGDAIKSPEPMSALEINTLMTWAAGGAPEGAPVAETAQPARTWALGQPDLTLNMPAPFTLDPARMDAVHEVTLSSRELSGRWIRSVDLLAGAPSIVRSADIVIKTGRTEQVVALWQPNDVPQKLEANAAFRVPSTGVVLRMRYQRPPLDRAAISDLSRVGFYFASRNPQPVHVIDIAESAGDRVIVKKIERQVRVIALRQVDGPADARARLTLIAPDGSRTPMVEIMIRPGWARRYAFESPFNLPAGSEIEIRIAVTPPGLWTTLTGDGNIDSPLLHLALDVID